MKKRMMAAWVLAGACVWNSVAAETGVSTPKPAFRVAGQADNDLYRILLNNGFKTTRYDSPAQAIDAAEAGTGVLILADGYPGTPTPVDGPLFERAAQKKLRVFVEYPAMVPDMKVDPPRRISMERVVVASDGLGPGLRKMQILAIHDCHFVPLTMDQPLLAVAKVAGFDQAVYGLAGVPSYPILFEAKPGRLLVSTTKLSQFVTARYAPKEAMQAVWSFVLGWLEGGKTLGPRLEWTATVRPSFAPGEKVPADAARRAIQRGIDWHTRSGMVLSKDGRNAYDDLYAKRKIHSGNPDGPQPPLPAGDGRFGVMEGVSSKIRYDGRQSVRWWLRSDCNGESSLAFALRWKMDGDTRSRTVATNLLDWVYFTSGLFQNDPAQANYGLLFWAPDNAQALYQDNDVKVILGCLGTAGILKTDRWDEVLVKNILGNFRTTGLYGFRNWRLENPTLLREGWQRYWRKPTVRLQPHYEAWTWASYLWLYDKTHWAPLLEKTRYAIGKMMDAYPDRWRWTNGIQQERGRMLLALAWLVRVDDRPEHRQWLKQIANDIERCQDKSGAIREELGPLGNGEMAPPVSNAAYGRHEAPLIQANGDSVSDLLYTCNFAFLGLNEAAAATGDEQYRRMADRLAEFLVRVQVRSETHPELDGGWFRAFDFRQWEYWASNADAGWGAWSIEVGWTQGWISSVLALREFKTSLWELSKDSQVARVFDKCRDQMFGDEPYVPVVRQTVAHAAKGKPVVMNPQPHSLYPGKGAATLTDGALSLSDHTDEGWIGFLGQDLEATIDLGQETAVRCLRVSFLRAHHIGIFLPKQIEVSVSTDGRNFQTVAKKEPPAPTPDITVVSIPVDANFEPSVRARYVRVHAVNFGPMPAWSRGRSAPAWLFADEIMVNPEPTKPEK